MMPHLVLARAARAGMTTSSPSLLASTSSDLSGGKQLIKGRGGWVEGRGGGGGGGGGEEEEEEKVRRLGHLETSSRALSKKPWSLSLVETRRCTWRRGGGGEGGGGEGEGGGGEGGGWRRKEEVEERRRSDTSSSSLLPHLCKLLIDLRVRLLLRRDVGQEEMGREARGIKEGWG